MLNYLRSRVYALTVSLILPILFDNVSCKISKNPTLLPVDFKTLDSDSDWRDLYAFISKVDGIIKACINNIHPRVSGVKHLKHRDWILVFDYYLFYES